MSLKNAIVVGLILLANQSTAQENCVAGLRIGAYDYIRSNVTTASFSVAQKEICDKYTQLNIDKQGGQASASYNLFDGGASFSREQLEAVGKMMCSADYSKDTADSIEQYGSAVISPTAMEAYRHCLSLNAKGLRVDISLRADDEAAVILTASYLRAFGNPPIITGIKIDPEGAEFSCEGTLWDAVNQGDGKPVPLNSSKSMLCKRQIMNDAVDYRGQSIVAKPATILVETEADAIRYHLPAIAKFPGPTEIELVRSQLPPVGSILLTLDSCPPPFYVDVTEQYEGRMIFASSIPPRMPASVDGNGDHGHSTPHSHSVSGQTAAHGQHRRWAAVTGSGPPLIEPNSTVAVTGSTDEVIIAAAGGAHSHSSIGMRLCERVSN